MICVKRDYEKNGAKVIIKGDERDLAIELNALLIQLEETPQLLHLFKQITSTRAAKLKEEMQDDKS